MKKPNSILLGIEPPEAFMDSEPLEITPATNNVTWGLFIKQKPHPIDGNFFGTVYIPIMIYESIAEIEISHTYVEISAVEFITYEDKGLRTQRYKQLTKLSFDNKVAVGPALLEFSYTGCVGPEMQGLYIAIHSVKNGLLKVSVSVEPGLYFSNNDERLPN